MTTRLASFIVCLVLATAACYVADAPLSPPTLATAEPKLYGAWRCVSPDPDGNELVVMRIAPLDSGRYDVEFVERGEQPSRYRGHGSLVGDQVIVNVQELRDGEPRDGWLFVRYDLLRDDVLQVRLISDRLLKALDSPGAKTEAIRKNIARADLYDDFCVCVRIHKK